MKLELFITEVDNRNGNNFLKNGFTDYNNHLITIEPHYKMDDDDDEIGDEGLNAFPTSPTIPFLQNPFQRSIGQLFFLDKGLQKQYPFHLFISLNSIKHLDNPSLLIDRYLNHILSFTSFPNVSNNQQPMKDPLFLAFLSNESFPSIKDDDDDNGFINIIYKFLSFPPNFLTNQWTAPPPAAPLERDDAQNEKQLKILFIKADKRLSILKTLLDNLLISLQDSKDLNNFISTRLHPILKEDNILPMLTSSSFTSLKEQIPFLKIIIQTEHDTILQYHTDKILKSLQRIYVLRLSLIDSNSIVANDINDQINVLLKDLIQYHNLFHKQMEEFWKDSNNLLKINR